MTPPDLLRTIYLGDRACKRILLDGWNDRVAVQVNTISRVRDPSGHWNFYISEDIDEGWIVFSGVRAVRFDPSGPLPNDYIEIAEPVPWTDPAEVSEEPMFLFRLTIGAGDRQGRMAEVSIEIIGSDVYLEDPRQPGVEIRE